MKQSGYLLLNYLDDFAGAEKSEDANVVFDLLGRLLDSCGLEESVEKASSPSTVMTFLGVKFDTSELTISVTTERVEEILLLVKTWLNLLVATVKQLQSLLGKLHFVSNCVRPGRLFVSRLLTWLRSLPDDKCDHIIPLYIRKDLFWWYHFLKSYNGVSMMALEDWSQPDEILETDATLSGCGGWFLEKREFFHVQFPSFLMDLNLHINQFELIALMICVKVWSVHFVNRKILVRCDNQSTVLVLNSGCTRDAYMQCCLREILFYAAKYNFEIKAVHFPGVENRTADILSRWHSDSRFEDLFYELPVVRLVPKSTPGERRVILDLSFPSEIVINAGIDKDIYLGRLLDSCGLEESVEKASSPSTVMTFLGVKFDTSELTISVTTERVEEILLLVKTWLNLLVATVKQLQSLLEDWSQPDEILETDATLSGCGGWFFEKREFFHVEFPSFLMDLNLHINQFELIALMICVKVWSVHFVNRKILVRCDNQSTVMVLNSGCTRDAYMQCCLREILFYAAKYNFEIKAVHFPGVENRTADILSRWHSDSRFEDLFYELPVVRIGLQRLNPHLPRKALPITPLILKQIYEFMDLNDTKDKTFWSLFLLAFFMMSRKSNLVPNSEKEFDENKQLCRGDIIIENDVLIIILKWSKTIPFGQRKLRIPISSIHGCILCPVNAYKNMIEAIPAVKKDPAFCKVKKGHILPIIYKEYQNKLRYLIQKTGRNSLFYSTHSFRRGGASLAFDANVSTELIQLHGHWHSDAYKKYLEFTLEQKLQVSQMISKRVLGSLLACLSY
ncbi:Hypothetical predicted protein [Mytilus galloprovincialis]|uniref:Tyr recombinase domain-containing protein n=1 Tax=Mytilus galloprovincialis TaxID=29158 RepID=A0A8B6CGE0_MYTGA|nr:Hypothetical predicted protein [Mytilus galloprovincialis]